MNPSALVSKQKNAAISKGGITLEFPHHVHQDPKYLLLDYRRLCVTRTGRLGLVPNSAREGEEILVFPGAVTPFVVRRSGNSRKLVGDCYIRGLMHGEGLLDGRMEFIVLS